MENNEKIIKVADGTEVIKKCAYAWAKAEEFILPDGLKKIEERAFSGCSNLKRVYIPASVEIIENDAFLYCHQLEIYCEDEPKAGWINAKETTRVYYEEPDGFNFHRSSGGWIDKPMRREEIIHNKYNPHKRPVHTQVSREQFAKLERAEK